MKNYLVAAALAVASIIPAEAGIFDMLSGPPKCANIQTDMKRCGIVPSDMRKGTLAGMIALERLFENKIGEPCELTSLDTLTWAFGYIDGTRLFAIKQTVTETDISNWTANGP
jgi:hypothetical protein